MGCGPEPKRGSGAGSGAEPLEAMNAFCTFLHKKWPKVKYLSENLPPCLSRAAMASPKFWSMGVGGGALTAHSWIRHWLQINLSDRNISYFVSSS